jgi:hypothetical protein
MNRFVEFMALPAGRLIRVIAGIGLMVWGLLGVGGTQGYMLAGIGFLPFLTGTLNICVAAPVLGAPLRGSKVNTASK